MTCKRTGTFREHHYTTIASLQDMTCCLIGGTYLTGTSLVDKNLVRLFAGIAYKRYLLQLVLHHPLEIATQETIDEEDVESALMVGNKDVRLIGLKMFATLNRDRQKECTRNGTGPPSSRIVAPKVAIAQSTTYTYQEGSPNRHQNSDGKRNNDLINPVEYLHFFFNVITTISPGKPKRKGIRPPNPVETKMAREPS